MLNSFSCQGPTSCADGWNVTADQEMRTASEGAHERVLLHRLWQAWSIMKHSLVNVSHWNDDRIRRIIPMGLALFQVSEIWQLIQKHHDTSTWGYLMHSTNDGRINRLWFPRCGFCLKNNVFVAGTPRRASWREVFKTPGLATWVLHMAIGTSWEINGNNMCGTFNLSSAWSQILLRMGCALKKTMQWVWVFVLCEFWDAQIRSQIGEHRQVSAFNPHEEETTSCVRRSQRVASPKNLQWLHCFPSNQIQQIMKWDDMTWHDMNCYDMISMIPVWNEVIYDMIWYDFICYDDSNFPPIWYLDVSVSAVGPHRPSVDVAGFATKSTGCPAGAYQQVTGLLSFFHVF